MATNLILKMPKLNGHENYGDWAFVVKTLMIEYLSKSITEVLWQMMLQLKLT